MDQPGVEVRPLRQMNGEAHFSEVFLDGARVRDVDRIGDVGGGWSVALATLAYERAGLSDERHAGVNVPAGERNGLLDRTCAEVLAHAAERPAGAPDDPASVAALVALAERCGRASDPVVRQRLAAVWSLEAIAEWTRGRVQAEVSAGREAGPGAATGKLAWTTRLALVRDLCLELLGPAGMLDGPDAPDGGRMQRLALSIPSASIAGGSDEIQRNIIGERVLGLPKDVAVDRDVPFREVRR
jgi:alkylation response protein AidB-like acyl-CoA dehydrogenase